MNLLCISTDLTSTELAAWVQAIGSIVAILAAAGIAIWQANRHLSDSLKLQLEEARRERTELAKTLSVLARNCSKAMERLILQVADWESVANVAAGQVHFDLNEAARLDRAIDSVPLQSLPNELVSPTMALAATIRQFREKIEIVLRLHREMNADEFSDFQRVLSEMNESAKATCKDIENAISSIENDA